MTTINATKYQCSPADAAKVYDWLKNRGGLMIWKSANLSNPGASWTTPRLRADGSESPKPTWEADEKPDRIITDAGDVEVVQDREVRRFRVKIEPHGLTIKLSFTSSERVRAAIEKAGPGATYKFDYSSQEAMILVPDKVTPISEWVSKS